MGYKESRQNSLGSGDFVGTGKSVTKYSPSSTAYGLSDALATVPIIYQRGKNKKGTPTVKLEHAVTTLSKYSAFDQETLAQVQKQMVQAGFLRTSKGNPVVFGMDSEYSYDAFNRVVMQAARQKKTVQEVLHDSIAKRQKAGLDVSGSAESSTGPASPIALTNPDDLRAVAMSVAQDELGMNADEEFIQHFISAVHNNETRAGRASDAGGVFTQAANPSAQAQAMLRKERPKQVQANSRLKQTNVLDDLIQKTKSNAG